MGVSKACLFCGGPGPFSKEHLIPEWAARLLKLKRVKVTRAAVSRSDTGAPRPSSWDSVGSFGTTIGPICKRTCNSGWMSDLENDARPILSKLIRPTGPVMINPDEQVIIASWLWKTAIVAERPTGVTYFTEEERTCLMRGDAPTPFGVHVWLAVHNGKQDASLRGGPSTMSSPDGHKTTGYLMTMHIRRFAAQMLCVREIPGVTVDAMSHFRFEGAELLIWPEQDTAVRWPPPAGGLNKDNFDKWHSRWNTVDPSAPPTNAFGRMR